MKNFARLLETLDRSNKTNDKIEALHQYFQVAADNDKVWAIALFTGKKPKRPVNSTLLKTWAAELVGIPYWLFEESYHIAGDLAETIALLTPQTKVGIIKSLHQWMQEIIALVKASEEKKKNFITEAWQMLDYYETFLFNKLITGSFRIGISEKNLIKALAIYTGIGENVIAHKLSGNWDPVSISFHELIEKRDVSTDASQPYPFSLAYALEGSLEELGPPEDWLVEHKWDGIRGQVIKRNGQLFVWSRGEELVTDKFPEYADFSPFLPDNTVFDGEIIPIIDDKPLVFQHLQKRIGRKVISKKLIQEVPVHFIAYDLLEADGADIRNMPLSARRAELEKLHKIVRHPLFRISEIVPFDSWDHLRAQHNHVRIHGAEGFMLKRKSSIYQTGRKKGDWWKWKTDPMTVDAVLIYAMAGHGRRANLYTDYTFAVWDGDALVPFTKAYSGLTDVEFTQVDQFIRRNTIEKFGPVRSVKPELVFEIAFEGIQASGRHKSGIALRFPRMKRWRQDKPASEANTLDDLRQLLNQYEQ